MKRTTSIRNQREHRDIRKAQPPRRAPHLGQRAAALAAALVVMWTFPQTAQTTQAAGPGETGAQRAGVESGSNSGSGSDSAKAGLYGPDSFVDTAGNVVPGVIEKGITVSKYQNRASQAQGGIRWADVKNSGVSFVMVRLGYHNDLDPYYHENMAGAMGAGLKTGVFFYTQALDTATAEKEARFVLSQVREYPVAYPVAYDLESQLLLDAGLTKQQITDQANAFCRVISQAGYRPIIYSNQEWLNNHIDASQLRDESGQPYDIWYARYGTVHEYPGRTIWQCTASGQVDGIAGDVAVEYAFVDYSTLIPAQGWKEAGGEWYYVKDYMNQTGWIEDGGKRYYLGTDGKMVHDVTLNIDGRDWVFGADGGVVE